MLNELTQRLLRSPDSQEGQGAGGGQSQGAGAQEGQQSQTAQEIFGQEGQGKAGEQGQQGKEGQATGGQQQQVPGQQGGGAGGQATPPPAISLDAVKALMQEMRQAPQGQPQQQQLSEEEFNKMFNVVKPTAEQWQAVRGDDPEAALRALTDLLHGSAKQAATLAAFHTMQEVQKIQQMLQPALKMAQAQELNQMKEEFFVAYPNLKGLEPLLMQIRDSFIVQKRIFDTKEAAFKAVAEEAQNLLSKIPGYQQGGNSNGAGGQSGQPQKQQQGRQMPTLSGKGQGGGAGGSGSAGPKSTAEKIFGPR